MLLTKTICAWCTQSCTTQRPCRDTNARPTQTRYLSARRVELRNYKRAPCILRAPRILRAPYVHVHSLSQLMRAPPNDTDRELLALPARLGGLGIVNPTKLSPSEHQASINISAPLRDLILEQNHGTPAPLRDLILEQNHGTPLNVSKLKSMPRGMSTNKIVTMQ